MRTYHGEYSNTLILTNDTYRVNESSVRDVRVSCRRVDVSMDVLERTISPLPFVRLRKPCNYEHYANAIATVSWMKYAGVHITIRMDKFTFLFPLSESQIENIVKHTANISRFLFRNSLCPPSVLFRSFSLFVFSFLSSGTVSADPNEWTHAKRLRYIKVYRKVAAECASVASVYMCGCEQAHVVCVCVCMCVYRFLSFYFRLYEWQW